MGIPDGSLLDLIDKVRSWITLSASDPSCFSGEFEMPSGPNMCYECDDKLDDVFHCFCCPSCGRWLCGKCVRCHESMVLNDTDVRKCIKVCRVCDERISVSREMGGKCYEKVHPAASPRESPEPCSPSCIGRRIETESVQSNRLASGFDSQDCSYSHAVTARSMASIRCYPGRGVEEETEDSGKHLLSPSSEYYQDSSDIDSSSVSARHEFFGCKSSGSSPYDSPCRNNFNPHGRCVQQGGERSPSEASFNQDTMAVLRKPNIGSGDPESHEIVQRREEKLQQPLDFENNGLIWYPPLPEDENDEAESNYFAYDDDDDDIGDSGAVFSSSGSFSNNFPAKEKQNESNNEPLRAAVHGHFRALVSQLLQGEGINPCNEGSVGDWLDVITTLAWQAANFVKPDTRRGGSMDPGDYVKVKCVASGSPNESNLVKGVVCTKNIKHKRMTSQYKNPRLLLLGGALEYQRVASQLASFNTLLQQENDHLKMIIGKIEALRPNVLLVEKSVSSYAQEYLLEKEISLVLNVKRSLLERIAQCTGALICPTVGNISTAQLGHCELFRIEKVTEEHEAANQFNRKPSKTLMYFEGCPRRLGCTVMLRGSCREELKKVKHVVQYALFAAYHLSLETSFLADEGACLPRMRLKDPKAVPEMTIVDADLSAEDDGSMGFNPDHEVSESLVGELDPNHTFPSTSDMALCGLETEHSDACNKKMVFKLSSSNQFKDLEECSLSFSRELSLSQSQEPISQEENQLGEANEMTQYEKFDEDDVSSEYFSATDTYQSILVSFSSRCVLKETICERSRLLRIKFYGSFDKPLGRYLRDDLFDQTSCCRSCKEPVDAHVLSYTHQQGNLTINVRQLSSMKLPGEQDGKIWMWHRCLRCAHIDGVPPATRRVVMSDAAWGLSFGKFLELSFSNHATANRVATCGHSLQRDCLRFYGFGSMVAFFRYSPIDILSVYLPPSLLEFSTHIQEEWITKEAAELLGKMQKMYAEISDVLDGMQEKSNSAEQELSDTCDLPSHIMDLKEQLMKEKHEYNGMLQHIFLETLPPCQTAPDILELNRLRRALLIGSHTWDRQLYSLNSLLNNSSGFKIADGDTSYTQPKELRSEFIPKDVSGNPESQDSPKDDLRQKERPINEEEGVRADGEVVAEETFSGNTLPPAASLSERIDSAWTGTCQLLVKVQPAQPSEMDGFQPVNSPLKRLTRPVRVHSFDSALRFQERIQKGLPPSSLYLSTLRSFHACGDYKNMVRDPVSNVMRTYSQMLPLEVQKFNLIVSSTPTYVSSASHIADGARLLIPQRGHNDIVIPVYDDDPASVISYALSSKEYEEWVADKSDEHEGEWNAGDRNKDSTSTFSAWRSFGSMDLDYIHYASYGSQETSSSVASLFTDDKKSSHLTISFSDDSSSGGGKVKFSVTCYLAKQFDTLRNKCCPSEMDFVRSLSRCQKWSAQGGKSNVYFAKSLNERFIIKQVKKTELDSFEEFAPEYFKYLTDSLNSGSPTCLAKVLGIYQVSIKHLKGGKETKMDLMVMENLFYKRGISRIYDLKGSARSRYNPDTSGANKVLLDMNLLETLRTEPIFLGSKAKRNLERAIWNDTSFLASVDVMDYSLLVGIDEERKELVLGIIDFMRQYTWDKHLETWVKASGILGGPKNASPTIVSPKQYKKRFRKAMTTYFLTVPDQWSS